MISSIYSPASSTPPPFSARKPRVPVLGQIPKRCRCCGASHDAVSWAALPWVGAFDDEMARLDLRNCVCGSTIAVEVES